MDPIGLAGGLNLYGFAGGDPVNVSDPFGLCPEGVQADSARGTGRRETTIYCADGSAEVRRGGSAAWRHNNPGNQRASRLAVGRVGGFAVFNTVAEGNEAHWRNLMGPDYQPLTLQQMVHRYAPASDGNDEAAYLRVLTDATGLPANTVLSTLTETTMSALIRAMQRHEGWRAGTVYIVPD
ncbi:MAG: hypothetical protein IPJ78_12360 [Gemmatimonadetes bacterium]|nr:hypothetical protein [Gemmatimonadota bacterium]